ncbi:hypothetical protein [Albibacterium bauzanense]|uniref:Uncharacterized protein n=1 Tax=Albibacterium bauzanense TaxID=653929 RepID=A0A4R1M259_9SPHI|nr:hypothetical protein [Albibacterium bauzanense]TCK85090.1 hypothetical protein C8N28_0388 [Albibacterium bauzanense]
MKKVFAISLFVFFFVNVQGQIVVNADGTHSIQHGPHIINPNGTISVQHGPHIINSDGSVSVKHGSVIVNTNGSHSTILGSERDDSNHSLELLSNKDAEKQQKSHQFYFQSRMMGTAARLDRFDAERKIRKEEKKLKKQRLRNK